MSALVVIGGLCGYVLVAAISAQFFAFMSAEANGDIWGSTPAPFLLGLFWPAAVLVLPWMFGIYLVKRIAVEIRAKREAARIPAAKVRP